MCDDDIHPGLVEDWTVSRRTFGLAGLAAAGVATTARAADVVEKDVTVKTADGHADAALFYPAGKGTHPAVLMWPDIMGLRPVFRAFALPHSQNLTATQHARLAGRLGINAQSMIAQARPDELQTIDGTETLWAELRWAARHEAVHRLDDLLLRRTRLGLLLAQGGAAILPRVREQGYGEDNEEQEEGLQCLAVPVFDRFGRVIAGLSISFPTMRCGADTKSHYIALLRNSGLAISTRLGYRQATAPEQVAAG